MSILKYPLELNQQESDYVIFRSFEYRTNSINLANNGSQGGASGPAVGDTITLFMPTSTPAMTNVNGWAQDSAVGPLGELSRSLQVSAANAVMEIGESGFLENTVSGIVAQFDSLKSKGLPALRQAGINKVAGFTGRSANQLLAMGKGKIYNPNVELLYDGPGLRAFDFTFIFAPKSKKEADIVNKIILEFKKWSSPNPKDGLFEVPAVWQIDYMVGNSRNKNMNAFKRSALTNVSTQDNSTLDMHMSYPDGMPITTTMTLSFSEVDIITRKDHLESGTNRGY
ncbi:baseplate tail tube cap [Synechococcus phage S-CRM01]|uniref:baseplate tail tube cap n=1 Tax=Synechococcus phage S-CRM01 TaxID=1026955 RepID=UPI000209E37F|nr:baseplate tail tube cap [Synechococcus phage S-CRM01]AEC53246.1 baseplate tail tube cap [Synechococcus phage S-CRM01]